MHRPVASREGRASGKGRHKAGMGFAINSKSPRADSLTCGTTRRVPLERPLGTVSTSTAWLSVSILVEASVRTCAPLFHGATCLAVDTLSLIHISEPTRL